MFFLQLKIERERGRGGEGEIGVIFASILLRYKKYWLGRGI
jgi:hypothetical protein